MLNNMTLNGYIDCLLHLPVNKKDNLVAPHKAVLLLTILELIKSGEIDRPFIPLTKSLEKAFKATWNLYVKSSGSFKCALNYPFYHLSSSPFWTLVKLPSFECRKEYSLSALKKSFAGAVIDEDLFKLMKDDASRSVIENILIKTYLSSEYPTHSSANVVLSTLAIFLLTVA